jgi:hypothetical protein
VFSFYASEDFRDSYVKFVIAELVVRVGHAGWAEMLLRPLEPSGAEWEGLRSVTSRSFWRRNTIQLTQLRLHVYISVIHGISSKKAE